MTDQSQDRQNGDGLLPCPLCKSASQASTAFDGSVYEGHVVICTSGKCGCQSGIFPTPAMARKAWNTRATPQPARDAAEGAGPNARLMPLLDLPPADQFDIATKLAENVGYVLAPDAYAAPPKPAPDAMLPSERQLAVSWLKRLQLAEGSEKLTDGECDQLECAIAFLSAPVPPADGAKTCVPHSPDEAGTGLRLRETLEEISVLNITPDTGASVAMHMRRIAIAALSRQAPPSSSEGGR